VVPLLQQRGLFHTEYPGVTLRQNLGLTWPSGVSPAAELAAGAR
jgi:hypothetical protein